LDIAFRFVNEMGHILAYELGIKEFMLGFYSLQHITLFAG